MINNLTEDNSVSIQILKDSIYSEYTKRSYCSAIRLYCQYLNIKEYDDLLGYDRNETINMIRRFLLYLRNDKKLSYGRLNVMFSGLKLYYQQNDFDDLPWSKLSRFKGKERKASGRDRTYTKEEIELMLSHADLRMKVIILTLLSTGMRVGGLASITLKDMKYYEDHKIFQFIVYSDSPTEQYYTFCTPECAYYINLYFNWRHEQGEILKPETETPFIRLDHNEEEVAISSEAIQERMRSLLQRSGILPKTITHSKNLSEEKKAEMRRHRNPVMRCHGLRKYFNTVCIESDMNIVSKELLMGHKKNLGLEKSYYRPTSNVLLNEYLKVVNDLTINDEHRLMIENEKLKQEIDERYQMLEKKFEETIKKLNQNQQS